MASTTSMIPSSLAEIITSIRNKIAKCILSSNEGKASFSSDKSITIKAPAITLDGATSISNLTITGSTANVANITASDTITAVNVTVTGALNIPGGKIWID